MAEYFVLATVVEERHLPMLQYIAREMPDGPAKMEAIFHWTHTAKSDDFSASAFEEIETQILWRLGLLEEALPEGHALYCATGFRKEDEEPIYVWPSVDAGSEEEPF